MRDLTPPVPCTVLYCTVLYCDQVRDLTPLYPVLRTWLANTWLQWRNLEQELGVGEEMRISNLRIGRFVNMLVKLIYLLLSLLLIYLIY